MADCRPKITNFGDGSCAITMKEIKRNMFTSTYKEDGTLNSILKTDAAAIANWQTLFDKKSFADDVLEKVVPTCIIYGQKSEQAEADLYDEAGYIEKLKDGNYNITFMVNGREAAYIKALKEIENNDVAIYMPDADTVVWGRETSAADLYLYPVPLINVLVPDFPLKSFDTPSQVMVTARVKTPAHMNQLTGIKIADGDVTLDTYFYSLIDGEGTITTPAVTGCIATIVDDRYNDPIPGLADDTDDYTYWNFYDAVAPTVAIPLADANSISESGVTGVYTINEAALLTTAHVYLLKNTNPRYDIPAMTVTVP